MKRSLMTLLTDTVVIRCVVVLSEIKNKIVMNVNKVRAKRQHVDSTQTRARRHERLCSHVRTRALNTLTRSLDYILNGMQIVSRR